MEVLALKRIERVENGFDFLASVLCMIEYAKKRRYDMTYFIGFNKQSMRFETEVTTQYEPAMIPYSINHILHQSLRNVYST